MSGKATQAGERLDNNPAFRKFFLFDYCKTKYDGLEEREIRHILHPYFQLRMQQGKHGK